MDSPLHSLLGLSPTPLVKPQQVPNGGLIWIVQKEREVDTGREMESKVQGG